MDNITATRSWTTLAGTEVTAEVKLILRKTINADGHKIETDCCEIGEVTADPTGHPRQYYYTQYGTPRVENGNTYVAAIGRLGLTDDTNKIVQDMLAEIKAHPAWVAKQEKIDRNMRQLAEMAATRNQGCGWCNNCQSNCYGDCEA